MNTSNRTIEEKLAIVQQLRSNSNASSNNKSNNNLYKTSNGIQAKQSNQNNTQQEESGSFLAFFIIRFVICILIFGAIILFGMKNPSLVRQITTIIQTEENGKLIDFMSPFTYTLQEENESTSEMHEADKTDTDAPSEE